MGPSLIVERRLGRAWLDMFRRYQPRPGSDDYDL